MEYVLNIAKRNGTVFYDGKHNPRYQHFARVVLPCNDWEEDVKRKCRQFAEAFPSPEYNLTLTRWRNSGVQLDFAEDMAAELHAMADAVATAEPEAS